MAFLQYFLASLVAYFGLFVGNILIFIAPEELKPGKKVFSFLRMILGMFMFIVLLTFYIDSLPYFFGILGMLVLIFILYWNGWMTVMFEYIFLSLIFFLSFKDQTLFIIEALLIFMFGLPTASLYTRFKQKKQSLLLSLRYSYFLVLATILFFLM